MTTPKSFKNLETLYGSQFTLSNRRMKPNCLVYVFVLGSRLEIKIFSAKYFFQFQSLHGMYSVAVTTDCPSKQDCLALPSIGVDKTFELWLINN